MAHSGVFIGQGSTTGTSVAAAVTSTNPLHQADMIWPDAGQPLTWGASVWLERSIPFSLDTGRGQQDMRGFGHTVAEGLASVGVYLTGRDYTIPASSEELLPYQPVALFRVTESVEVQQETTSFETRWEADPNLELDSTAMTREGREGVRLKRYAVTAINGEVVQRILEDAWVQQEPEDRLMSYGTMVVVRTVDTPSGPMQYWRHFRALVTSYSPSTAGQSPSSPHYGLTRSGKVAGTGMVAVDPSVIPMGTAMYIPGYGVGVAEDTGSGVKGRHIDVCYDDDELVHWYRWVDIYLLAPAPPNYAVRWLLPNWPPER